MARLVDARYEADYRVWLRFSDGLEGVVDLAADLYGEVFEPLRKLTMFAQLRLDPDTHTITWPTGADLAPEFLHERVREVANPPLQPAGSARG